MPPVVRQTLGRTATNLTMSGVSSCEHRLFRIIDDVATSSSAMRVVVLLFEQQQQHFIHFASHTGGGGYNLLRRRSPESGPNDFATQCSDALNPADNVIKMYI